MGVPVACELMTFSNDGTNKPRVSLGYPSEHKKRCRHACVRKETEHLIGIRLDPARETLPRAAIDASRKGLHLEVILHIDRHGVADAATPSRGPAVVRLEILITG